MHLLLDPCDVVHPKTLGRIVLNTWDVIPSDYTHHLVTVAANRHDLKLLFRNCEQLKKLPLVPGALRRVGEPGEKAEGRRL